MKYVLALLTLVTTMSAPSAQADTVAFSGVPTFVISPSADTYGLAAGSSTVSSGGTVTQAGTFYEGHSGNLVEDIPISFTEAVTVDGITRNLTFTGDDDVTLSYDTLTINALGPVAFGADILDFAGSTGGQGSVTSSVPLTATFTAGAVTAEPSSLTLLGTGMLSALGVVRCRSRRP